MNMNILIWIIIVSIILCVIIINNSHKESKEPFYLYKKTEKKALPKLN